MPPVLPTCVSQRQRGLCRELVEMLSAMAVQHFQGMIMFARKTQRGLDELAQRSLKLGILSRRLLIFIDGQRDHAELQRLVGGQDITPLLAELTELGCIEGGSSATSPPVAPAASTQTKTVATDVQVTALPKRSAQDLDKGRHFIINTLSTFTGPYAHADLMSTALQAPDQPSLRALLPAWRAALEVSTTPRRLEELQVQLLKVI